MGRSTTRRHLTKEALATRRQNIERLFAYPAGKVGTPMPTLGEKLLKRGRLSRSIEKIKERRERSLAFVEVWDKDYNSLELKRELVFRRTVEHHDFATLRKSDLEGRHFK